MSDLGGLRDLSWVATAYLLTGMASGPLYGKLGDLYGRKRIFLVAIVIFLVGSVLCGLAGSMTQLIMFRAVQGVGAGDPARLSARASFPLLKELEAEHGSVIRGVMNAHVMPSVVAR